MALVTYPLNDVDYQAEDAELFHCTRSSGIYAGDDFSYSVTGADNTMVIGPGVGWIRNSRFSGKVIANKADLALDFGLADAVYPRIDAVVIQFDINTNQTELKVKKGVPASVPQVPAVSRTESMYELHLYHVRREAGAVSFSVADITDLRMNENYCGLMADSVTSVDTTAINAQVMKLIEHLRADILSVKDGSAYVMKDGTVAMTGNLLMGGFRVTEVGAPEADGDAVNRKYVQDNFRPSTWTPTAAEVGAAPAGFINHAFATNGDVTNLLLIDGTQYGQANKPQRVYAGDVTTLSGRPDGFPASGPYIGYRTVDWYEASRFVVTVYEAYPVPGRIWVNHFNVSAWDGWCCVAGSVPMMPGVEYCTTKRYQNVPVYTKKLSDVWVPAGQFVEAATGVDHNHLISYKAMMRNGNYAMAEMLPYHNYLGNLLGNVRQTANGIAIDNFDTEDFSAEIYIEYWK